MDETYVKIKGQGAYLYRAVDTEGHTIDFLLTPTRDRGAAEAFLRQAKYLKNRVEPDQRAVKRKVRPRFGCKSFWAARCTIAGIEVMHAIRKGQLAITGIMSPTPAEQFYGLAA